MLAAAQKDADQVQSRRVTAVLAWAKAISEHPTTVAEMWRDEYYKASLKQLAVNAAVEDLRARLVEMDGRAQVSCPRCNAAVPHSRDAIEAHAATCAERQPPKDARQ